VGQFSAAILCFSASILGYQNYPYNSEVVPETDVQKNIKVTSIKWEKRDFENRSWKTYIMITRIEDAFRSMKLHLGLRPVFHQNKNSADAHIFISVFAYHIL